MNKFSAVVYTAGRTGSHLLIKNLCKHYDVAIRSDRGINFTDGIVHTHNPLYTPPTKNFTAIISRRHNLFESILSMELTKLTNEFVAYTNKKITPYLIDIENFKNCYFFQKAFYRAIDCSAYRKVVDIYYEDLISDLDCLWPEFNIKLDISNGKSPYNYYDIITNVDELKEVYQQLEQVDITEEEIIQFKKTVQKDLDDIRINHNGNRR